MAQSIAAPRVRQRRRRPMPPSLKWALGWFVFTICFAVYDLLQVVNGDVPVIPLVCFGIQIVIACVSWPQLQAEWKRWRDS